MLDARIGEHGPLVIGAGTYSLLRWSPSGGFIANRANGENDSQLHNPVSQW